MAGATVSTEDMALNETLYQRGTIISIFQKKDQDTERFRNLPEVPQFTVAVKALNASVI